MSILKEKEAELQSTMDSKEEMISTVLQNHTAAIETLQSSRKSEVDQLTAALRRAPPISSNSTRRNYDKASPRSFSYSGITLGRQK